MTDRETPRTDELLRRFTAERNFIIGSELHHLLAFQRAVAIEAHRQLERELSAAQERVKELEDKVRWIVTDAAYKAPEQLTPRFVMERWIMPLRKLLDAAPQGNECMGTKDKAVIRQRGQQTPDSAGSTPDAPASAAPINAAGQDAGSVRARATSSNAEADRRGYLNDKGNSGDRAEAETRTVRSATDAKTGVLTPAPAAPDTLPEGVFVPREPTKEWILRYCALTNREPMGTWSRVKGDDIISVTFYEMARDEIVAMLAAADEER